MAQVYIIIYKTDPKGILFTWVNKSYEGYRKALHDFEDRNFIILDCKKETIHD